MVVRMDTAEIARIEPSSHGAQRADSPLQIGQLAADVDSTCLELEADTGPVRVTDFVICVVRTAPALTVTELLAGCSKQLRRAAPNEVAILLSRLRSAESGEVTSASPWLQPLCCPLSQSRMRIPARGRDCQHLRCFDLEAYFNTSARIVFHRRWRCPICDCRLLPENLVICSLTEQLLGSTAAEVTTAPLESACELAAPEVPVANLLADVPSQAGDVAAGVSSSRKGKRSRQWTKGILETAHVGGVTQGAGEPPCSMRRSIQEAPSDPPQDSLSSGTPDSRLRWKKHMRISTPRGVIDLDE